MTTLALSGLIFLTAAVYTAVGQAGASGYIAAMALFGVPADSMKPLALSLNVLVASYGTWRLGRAGWTAWPRLWPFLAGSVPLAFLGGLTPLPNGVYRMVVGAVLVFAGWRLFQRPGTASNAAAAGGRTPPLSGAMLAGAGIGLLAGLTGIGGGIFLTPLLLFLGWAEPKQAAGLSAPFILVNSAAALAGNVLSLVRLPPETPVYAAAALAGAVLGTQVAVRTLSPLALRRILAVILLATGARMILA
ncbi:MAG: sulfite exporter TauE/SafE family protein [Acetobacteraceae bacterium]